MTSPYVSGGLIGVAIMATASGAVYYFEPTIPEINLPTVENPFKRESLAPVADQPLPPQEGCADQLTLKVAKNIQDHPEQWTSDEFRMERAGGVLGKDVKLWVANSDYGLDFLTSDRFSNTGIKYPFTESCRAYLYTVTQDYMGVQARLVQEAAKAETEKERHKIEDALKGI